MIDAVQRWFLAEVKPGSDIEACIRLEALPRHGQPSPFSSCAWLDLSDILPLTVSYRRGVYARLISEFKPVVQRQHAAHVLEQALSEGSLAPLPGTVPWLINLDPEAAINVVIERYGARAVLEQAAAALGRQATANLVNASAHAPDCSGADHSTPREAADIQVTPDRRQVPPASPPAPRPVQTAARASRDGSAPRLVARLLSVARPQHDSPTAKLVLPTTSAAAAGRSDNNPGNGADRGAAVGPESQVHVGNTQASNGMLEPQDAVVLSPAAMQQGRQVVGNQKDTPPSGLMRASLSISASGGTAELAALPAASVCGLATGLAFAAELPPSADDADLDLAGALRALPEGVAPPASASLETALPEVFTSAPACPVRRAPSAAMSVAADEPYCHQARHAPPREATRLGPSGNDSGPSSGGEHASTVLTGTMGTSNVACILPGTLQDATPTHTSVGEPKASKYPSESVPDSRPDLTRSASPEPQGSAKPKSPKSALDVIGNLGQESDASSRSSNWGTACGTNSAAGSVRSVAGPSPAASLFGRVTEGHIAGPTALRDTRSLPVATSSGSEASDRE